MHMHVQLISNLSCLISCVHQFVQLRLVASTRKCSCALLNNSNQAVFCAPSPFFHPETRCGCVVYAPQYIWYWFALLHCLEPSKLAPGYSAIQIDAILKEDGTAVASSGCPRVPGPKHFTGLICGIWQTSQLSFRYHNKSGISTIWSPLIYHFYLIPQVINNGSVFFLSKYKITWSHSSCDTFNVCQKIKITWS